MSASVSSTSTVHPSIWRCDGPTGSRLIQAPAAELAAGLAGASPPVPAAVSFVVSFAEIRERPLKPTGHGHPRSRTVPASHERWGAHLESVLGATPREFESRILRCADLRRCAFDAKTRPPGHEPWSQFRSQLRAPGGSIPSVSSRCCAWSWAPRTAPNRAQHAAQACARQFNPARARPRCASRRQRQAEATRAPMTPAACAGAARPTCSGPPRSADAEPDARLSSGSMVRPQPAVHHPAAHTHPERRGGRPGI
jgi:hypothetical protein